MNFEKCESELKDGLKELCPELGIPFNSTGRNVVSRKIPSGLSVSFDGGNAVVGYCRKSDFFRALSFLKEGVCVQEQPAFETLGLMMDCSRNAVTNLKSLKKMIRVMALMGYNALMLYTEDTYEIPGQPYFGYMRGRYTQQELREIDRYAAMFGIEVIPCIQTLAHLNAIRHWRAYCEDFDCDDILMVDEENIYGLIEKMIADMASVFKSRRIHIGMDEAHMLGLGRHLDKYGYQNRFEILLRHQKRVIQICEKYGFQPMIWSDMYFKLLSKTDSYYDTSVQVTNEVKNEIPDDLNLVYWDYDHMDQDVYEKMLDLHFEMSRNVSFAGGAWKWTGFVPQMNRSFVTSRAALSACLKKNVKNVYVTAWGDNGGACQTFSILPTLQLYAEECYSQDGSDAHIAERLKACTKADLKEFMQLDLPNLEPDGAWRKELSNPADYLFYQDILCGLFDRHVGEGCSQYYRTVAGKLHDIAGKGEDWSYIFDNLANLCDVLSTKCDIGVRLKKNYDDKDKQALADMACRELPGLYADVEKFHKSLRKAWMKENKPFGMDVQDIRIGGLLARIKAAQAALQDYLSGEIDKIEELDQERLFYDCRDEGSRLPLPLCVNSWSQMASAGVLSF